MRSQAVALVTLRDQQPQFGKMMVVPFKFMSYGPRCQMHCKNNLPAALPGWELSSTAHGSKLTMCCTKRDSHGNQCIGIIRCNSNPDTRHSLFHSDTVSPPKQTQIEHWPQLCLEDRLRAEIASLVAGMDSAPAIVVQN
jgi:hypothetical protein